MRIVLIGADGQLGSDLKKTLQGEDLFPLYYPEFDVTRPQAARDELAALSPEIVINTAAYHRVDECEDHPRESFLVNAVAVHELAGICREIDAMLVHFSTDYVFDGGQRVPYTEKDRPNPLSVYAASKLAGEYLIRNRMDKYFLIRTCGLYGEAGPREKGRNFVDAMVGLSEGKEPVSVVSDQWVTPTSTLELAERILELIQTRHYGLYHMTNEGQCTWHEFAQAIFGFLGRTPCLRAVTSLEYKSRARRPSYSVLENRRAKEIGLSDFSHWKDALRAYLAAKGLLG
ncbi:MAG: dTDP-4-dehydrorhamnose reductase [Acidobacteriota bacterium]|nr:dTDP-4-dehydrorhamnose reductase [Acidobacteriota bacterium]